MQIDRAVIEINGGCNFACEMCPQSSPTGRPKGFLRKMGLMEFENVVAQCAEAGLNVVNLDGSGEATLNRNLPEYIKIVKKYGAKAFIFSNGYRMHGNFMHECVDAGLDFFRFSIIGYDDETYSKWMNQPSGEFANTVNKMIRMREYVEDTKSDCVVASYHLILDNNNIDHELAMYRKVVAFSGVATEIWKMHNWSGVYDPEYGRHGKLKTCGRPFSPDIVVRAGGNDGMWGAVHPCCQVLGRDDEAVLGHVQEKTIREIWNDEPYETLREQHRTGNFPDFCKDCDFLIDDPNVLLYTNHNRDLYKMVGTNFNLDDYRK